MDNKEETQTNNGDTSQNNNKNNDISGKVEMALSSFLPSPTALFENPSNSKFINYLVENLENNNIISPLSISLLKKALSDYLKGNNIELAEDFEVIKSRLWDVSSFKISSSFVKIFPEWQEWKDIFIYSWSSL